MLLCCTLYIAGVSYNIAIYIQGVHIDLLQFKKFITQTVDEISYINLFYINLCLLKFLVKLKICIFNKCVNKPLQNGYFSKEGTICMVY